MLPKYIFHWRPLLAFVVLWGLMCLITILSLGTWFPVWRFVLPIIGAHIPYFALVLLFPKTVEKYTIWLILGAAFLLRITLLFGAPVFSDDIYRFIWDGKISASNLNPYDYPPDAPELVSLRDAQWTHINNKELRTIYPPGAQTFFKIVYELSPSILGFKLFSVFADLLVVFLIYKICALRRGTTKETLLYALNPLICVETALSGHLLEPLAISCMLGAIFLIQNPHWIRGVLPGAALFGTGVALKLAPAIMLPTLTQKNKRFLLPAIGIVGIWLIPMFLTGIQSIETLGSFARRWEGNAGLFTAIKFGFHHLICWTYGVSNANELVHLPFMDQITIFLQNTFFSLHKDGGFDQSKAGAFTVGDLSLFLSKAVCLLIFIAVMITSIKNKFPPVKAGLWLLGTLVIITPVLHPWYVLWVLPFAAMKRVWPWFGFTALLPLAYLPLDNWWLLQQWIAPSWTLWVQYIPFAIFLIASRYIHKKKLI